MLGENSEVSILAVPALSGGEQPVGILFKSVAEVIARDFKSAGRRLHLCGTVAGLSHLQNHSLKANFLVWIIQKNHDRKPAVA
jgi:hypothetical protein